MDDNSNERSETPEQQEQVALREIVARFGGAPALPSVRYIERRPPERIALTERTPPAPPGQHPVVYALPKPPPPSLTPDPLVDMSTPNDIRVRRFVAEPRCYRIWVSYAVAYDVERNTLDLHGHWQEYETVVWLADDAAATTTPDAGEQVL